MGKKKKHQAEFVNGRTGTISVLSQPVYKSLLRCCYIFFFLLFHCHIDYIRREKKSAAINCARVRFTKTFLAYPSDTFARLPAPLRSISIIMYIYFFFFFLNFFRANRSTIIHRCLAFNRIIIYIYICMRDSTNPIMCPYRSTREKTKTLFAGPFAAV